MARTPAAASPAATPAPARPAPAPHAPQPAERQVAQAAGSPPAPAPARPSSDVSELVVTSERRAEAPGASAKARPPGGPADETAEVVVSAGRVQKASPDAALAALSPPAASVETGVPTDPAARLRAAAAAGRMAEVKALLAQGAPVDAPDADGETALMKSIQADQPAVAALLSRRGANLDRKNHAGASARDMARSIGDAKLDRALRLDPR